MSKQGGKNPGAGFEPGMDERDDMPGSGIPEGTEEMREAQRRRYDQARDLYGSGEEDKGDERNPYRAVPVKPKRTDDEDPFQKELWPEPPDPTPEPKKKEDEPFHLPEPRPRRRFDPEEEDEPEFEPDEEPAPVTPERHVPPRRRFPLPEPYEPRRRPDLPEPPGHDDPGFEP